PPTINLTNPNPYYDGDVSPFKFNDKARPWADETRRAGLSAFGFGGTNFHAVISSYDGGDRPQHGLSEWPAELFLVRGVSEADAARVVTDLSAKVAAVLETDPSAQRHLLRILACAAGRQGRGPVRAAFVASSFSEVAQRLAEAVEAGFATASEKDGSDGPGQV